MSHHPLQPVRTSMLPKSEAGLLHLLQRAQKGRNVSPAEPSTPLPEPAISGHETPLGLRKETEVLSKLSHGDVERGRKIKFRGHELLPRPVNDAVPQQMGLPGTCARLCRAHSDSSSMAVKEETLRTPAHINKIRWVIAAVPSGTIPQAQPGQFLVLERRGQAFEVFLLVR